MSSFAEKQKPARASEPASSAAQRSLASPTGPMDAILDLQRAIGNRAVTRLILADASTQKPSSGEKTEAPSVEATVPAKAQQAGNIKAALTYKGSVKRWGIVLPEDFGDTYGRNSGFTGGTISPEKDGTFSIAGTLEHPVTYQVRFGIGPRNQRDIASETDEKVTQANYRDVASDLTPNGDGYPPRQNFWAQDLTERHELVHVQEYLDNGPSAMAAATTWLNAQTVADPEEINALVDPLLEHFSTALSVALPEEKLEKHAYTEGAPAYKARADAIRTKGKNGEYK